MVSFDREGKADARGCGSTAVSETAVEDFRSSCIHSVWDSAILPLTHCEGLSVGDNSFLSGIIVGDRIVLHDPRLKITPQPEPTTPRIKALLKKGLTTPDKMTPAEVQEMTASVVYHLIMRKKD